MSAIQRQSNLFASEDFTKVYKSFQDIDFTAYDFDTIQESLVDYIKIHYPEDFNDYIESSEFIAIIELLAYLGTSLSFRVDLNSRENIMDTAQRRESIIRLARMVNYQPKRNLAANGLFKIASLTTDQLLTDSVGNPISNTPIFWADPNNPDWFDQFVTILNGSLNSVNPFGRPTKSGKIGNTPTDLYELNNIVGLDVTYPIGININGKDIPIDVVNPNFEDNLTFFERPPDPNQSFNFIYRNDSLGVSSDNTGFFLYFRQGSLQNRDERYDFPIPNRVEEIDINNINQTDVYVQEINEVGDVEQQWKKVPSVSGTNVIYNSINFNERDIFEVVSGLNDTVAVKFPDGNFGNIPTGIIRYWVRTSEARNIIIRPEDATNLQITIPYIGADEQQYNLRVMFNLKQTISNSAPAETNAQIKTRAPQTFYTQERMINNEDYNVFPLVFGNEIAKLRSINRTHAGHSRFVEINDPTGFHQNLTILGEDGALFNQSEEQSASITLTPGISDGSIIYQLQSFMKNNELRNFFFDNYLNAFRDQFGQDYFTLPPENGNYWKTSPDKIKNDTGYYIKSLDDIINWPTGPFIGSEYENAITLNTVPYNYITAGAVVSYVNDITNPIQQFSTSIKSVTNSGQPIDPAVTNLGTVENGSEVINLWQAVEVTPNFKVSFDENDPLLQIIELLDATQSFGLGYDLINQQWYIMSSDALPGQGNTNPNPDSPFTIIKTEVDPFNPQIDRDNPAGWIIILNYVPGDGQSNPFYELISRGTVTTFQSSSQVRFYWEPGRVIFDTTTGRAREDLIQILPDINDNAEGEPLQKSIFWSIVGMFTSSDGYQDPSLVKVLPSDLNSDGTPDNPASYEKLVKTGDISDEVIFEKYIDLDGYQKIRPWQSGWVTDLLNTNSVIVIIPDTDPNELHVDDMGFRDQNDPTSTLIPLSEGQLFFLKFTENNAVFDDISTQLEIFLRSPNLNTRTNANKFMSILQTKSFRNGAIGTNIQKTDNYRKFVSEILSTIIFVNYITDPLHYGLNGISFSQNSNIMPEDFKPLTFKWRHYSPADQRIDPSISNIIDMIVLTEEYYNSILIWKNGNNSINIPAPTEPTTEELRIQFGDLNKFKSVSDQIIFNSGQFKLLFGPQADKELQATFKAVKIPTSIISDNEIKTRIILAIDQYFDINNWDFGERFFYTELAAFIHTQLSKFLSSVVIVPTKEDSEFGNLFEIVSAPSELFLSTATVSNVELVDNYTETNLRI